MSRVTNVRSSIERTCSLQRPVSQYPIEVIAIIVMKQRYQFFVAVAALTISVAAAAESSAIIDAASAILAAKQYTKASCNAVTPCTYKAQREGKQWRVAVKLTKRNSPRGAALPYAGGDMFLYFDSRGHLIRRLGGE